MAIVEGQGSILPSTEANIIFSDRRSRKSRLSNMELRLPHCRAAHER